jgi:cbb3-type cytochrome oxidase maturation protein
MTVMLWLIFASLTVAGGGLAVFLWSLRSGQYEDLEGAANRILFDD